jgi:hypothetical protein
MKTKNDIEDYGNTKPVCVTKTFDPGRINEAIGAGPPL